MDEESKVSLATTLRLILDILNESEESPGVSGLGLLQGRAERFQTGRVPQLGWNDVEAPEDARLLEPGTAYYANSYRVVDAPGVVCATSDYGGRFVAAIEDGPLVGCQFHPELSGAYGRALLARWVEGGAAC